jgi:uncharacterized protein
MDHGTCEHSILWKNITHKGHEFWQQYSTGSGYALEGTAVFLHDEQPYQLNYRITTDLAWQTLSASIAGWVWKKRLTLQIEADHHHHWWVNEAEVPAVSNCIDIDLNFSPLTNLLPIRRLGLEVGEKAMISAAWLKFPSFNLEPLPQQYERIDTYSYRYSSNNGLFIAELRMDAFGFVSDYPGIWVAETG